VNTEPLRLRLLNDYEVVVAGLRAMLEPFDDRVRVVEEDIRSISGRRVDLTLYDTFGRTLDEQRNLGELVADPATGTVVVYAWNAREAATEGDGEASGVEYLDKSLPAAELVASLERIAGRGVAPGAAAPRERPAAVRLAEPQSSWPGREEGLSVREAEVVALITQGHTNPEIAASLYLSLNSLKSYIRSAYRKMGVERRSQAVRWGIEHGMLPPRKGEH
jgi:DNA-binding NarL/FixJ family response regulator